MHVDMYQWVVLYMYMYMPYTCTCTCTCICVHSLKFNMLVCLVFPLKGNGVILSQHPCSETLSDSDVRVLTCSLELSFLMYQ